MVTDEPNPEKPALISAERLASRLSVSATSVYRMARNKLIPSYAIGGGIRFDEAEVLAALRNSFHTAGIGAATTAPPLAPVLGADADGDDAARALIAVLARLAESVPDAGESRPMTAAELLAMAEEMGLAAILAGGASSPVKRIGHRMRQMPGRILKDERGRKFEIETTGTNVGKLYTVRMA